MKQLVLLIWAIAALLCTLSAAERAPFLLKVLKELSGDFGACSVNCVAKDSHILEEYMAGTCGGEVMSVQEEYQSFALGPDHYKDIFQSQGYSPSRMCMWYRRVTQVCAVDLLQEHLQCTPMVVDTTKDIIVNFDEFLCSTDPPILECIMSPDFTSQGQDLFNCTQGLTAQILPYFQGPFRDMSNFIQAMRRFYSMEVEDNNGDFLYNGVPNMVQCMTSILGDVTLNTGGNCKKVQDLFNKEVDALITYIKDETDVLMCVLNPDLMTEMMRCGNSFMLDLSSGLEVKQDGGRELQENMVEYLMRSDFYAFRSPFKKLKFCLEQGVMDYCGDGWVYGTLNRYLEAMEFMINTNGKTLPPFCIPGHTGTTTRGSAGSALQQTSLKVLMTSLLTLSIPLPRTSSYGM